MIRPARTPGAKLAFALLVAGLLAIPLFTIYLLVYDRQSQSEAARASIAQGWGGPQAIAGPLLVIPYSAQATETVTVDNRPQTRTVTVRRELFIAPTRLELTTKIAPERRQRSIYETVVYEAVAEGRAVYRLPPDLARLGIAPGALAPAEAELRFGLSDPRGLGTDNRLVVDGRPVPAQPGNGLRATNGSGFFAGIDASTLGTRPMTLGFRFAFRGHSALALEPRAGETLWRVASPWPHPSFTGGFLPENHKVGGDGFEALWRISNLALGTTLATTEDVQPALPNTAGNPYAAGSTIVGGTNAQALVNLIEPVDLYSQVNRSVKYGFLFIGFTFAAFLMFDVVAGVPVSAVEYLLVGAGLVLFFVLLLAFAEVIGFTAAYLLAAAAIVGLLTAYSVAVLGSRRRAGVVGGLLVALYGVLYLLLSLEAFSLLIGSVLLFLALAAVMYLTRRIDWSGERTVAEAPAA